ncbi:MAG: multicopper oxidase family protein [Acidimicrobiaceae bacterium]|nr:multicopper oxidase family protein [Acidimicrobiaceae bacterium]
MNHAQHGTTSEVTATFSTDVAGLEDAARPVVAQLDNGDTYELRIAAVAKNLGDRRVRMLSYNGSIPGPTLRVRQGSEVVVQVDNDGDTEATIHWHGLRLDNAYDGVPFETQRPIEIGGRFTYRLRFPDPGLYWYHPHIREDYGLDMGLYGNIVVEPADEDYWPLVDREVVVTLDDVLVEDGRIAAFHEAGPTHVAMGRFGNLMLTGGETNLTLDARVGEVVRFYFTNTANTRLFNVALPGTRMKLVGSDSGRYEHETFVNEVLLAPSERAVVDVRFQSPGGVMLEHRTPERIYTLGTIAVTDAGPKSSDTEVFEHLRTSDELANWRGHLDAQLARPPDKTLAFKSLMPLLYGDTERAAAAYTCPMHPEVVVTEPGICSHCGMKLVPAPRTYVCPMHADISSETTDTCPKCGMRLVPHTASADLPHAEAHEHGPGHAHAHDIPDGLEWEDLMPEINAASNADNMTWRLVDLETGKVNGGIDWAFRVGDLVKIRLVNDMDQDHPMHHPFHIHGAGRFLILTRGEVVESNLAWKDTVLVRSGETVDILLDVTNSGLWMAHCHIAEHNQSGMMFSFSVHES